MNVLKHWQGDDGRTDIIVVGYKLRYCLRTALKPTWRNKIYDHINISRYAGVFNFASNTQYKNIQISILILSFSIFANVIKDVM